MALPKHKKCVFAQETFFDITEHPQVKRFSKQEFFDMIADSGLEIEKAGLWDRVQGKNPVEIKSEPDFINLEVDSDGKKGDIDLDTDSRQSDRRNGDNNSEAIFWEDAPGEKFQDQSNRRTSGGEGLPIGDDSFSPGNDNRDNENDDRRNESDFRDDGLHGSYPSIELSDEAWKTIIGIFFKYLFKIASAKTGTDMELDPDELEDIERVTMPLVHKYGMFQFKYAQEFTFIATIAMIIYKKHLIESVNEIVMKKNTEKEVFEKSEIKGNGAMENENAKNIINNLNKTGNKGTSIEEIYGSFEKNKDEMMSVPMRDITEDEYKMCIEFCEIMEPGGQKPEISQAKAVIHFIEFSGFKMTDLMGAMQALGPSIFQDLMEKMKNGKS